MAGSLGDLVVRVGATIDGFQSAMREIQDSLDQLGHKSEESSEKVESGFSGMISAIREHASEFRENCEAMAEAAIGLQVVGHELSEVLTERIKEIGEESLKAAANTEQLEIVFQSLTGSAESAGEMVENLHKFAGGSVFGMGNLEQGAQRLMAFGFAGKDVIPILQTLGNVSQAFGKGDTGTEELIDVLGRIREMGTLSSRNLRGLNMFGGTSALASGMGITESEVLQRSKTGASGGGGIPATEGINALLSGWQQNFGGIAEKELGTFNGMLANLKNQIELTMDEIGQSLLPVAKVIAGALDEVVGWLKQAAEWFRTLPQPVQDFALAIVAVVAGIGPLLVLLGGLGIAFATVVGSMGALVTAFDAIAVAAAAFGVSSVVFLGWAAAIAAAVGVAVAALAAFGVWIAQHWEGVKAATAQVWDGIQDIWNATLGVALNWVIARIEELVALAKPAWNAFKEAIVDAWDAITDVIGTAWGWIKDNVVDPMMKWLEAIPGVTKGIAEIAGAGSAFNKAEQEKKDRDQTNKDLTELGVGSGQGGFHVLSNAERFKEDHAAKIKEEGEALERLKEAYSEGRITLDQLNAAQAKYNALLAEKGPATDAENAAKSKQKIDRNALDALSAAHAHQEAILAAQKASVDHAYQMSQLGTGDKVGMDDSELAQMQIDAGQKRMAALDALALQERDATLKELDAKLALYKGDQDGYQKLVGEKTAAEDKYQAELQKNKDAQELIVKKANDQMTADDLKQFDEDLKAQAAHNEAILKLQDAVYQQAQKHANDMRELQDEYAQIRLDRGEITENQYLQIQRQAMDAAYQAELDDIARERALLQQLRDNGEITPDEYNSRSQKIDARQQDVTDRHDVDVLKNTDSQQKNTYNAAFKPLETSFSSSIVGLIEGTKSFSQAWRQMVTGMLNSWITTLAQMAARWVAHKLMELTLHVTTEQAKTAATAAGAAAQNQISLAQHFREIARSAAQAAAKAWGAVVGIPIVGPILAPIAAAATFVGVMALGSVSAEHGAVLPNENTVAFLHPREMVLPAHLSEGLQNMFAGRFPNANSMTHVPSGGMSPQTLQAMRGATQAGTEHHWGGVQITVHNSTHSPIDGAKIYDAFQGEVRRRNLKMA